MERSLAERFQADGIAASVVSFARAADLRFVGQGYELRIPLENGRLDDIEIVARTLKGKHVAEGTRMLVFPASWRIYSAALKSGYVDDLIAAGAVVCNPGCGPCLGVHQGALGDNETALATTNRNFKGRMGNPGAEVFLCSPAVAATSALTGAITDPTEMN